jgi:hypothetical protein
METAMAPALIPAITSESGEHSHAAEGPFNWHYRYEILAAGSRGERREGRLSVEGFTLAECKPGDHIQTPWGTMQRAADTKYERGFLLEHTHGRPIDTARGTLHPVPEGALARGGLWKSAVGQWRYSVTATAMGSKSERRIGRLSRGRLMLTGEHPGEGVETPWGRLFWMGPLQPETPTDYEQGWLLFGTGDRPLDGQEAQCTEQSMRLESLYLPGVRLAADGPTVHRVALEIQGSLDETRSLAARLIIDPNTCSLNAFGDRQGCTKMAQQSLDVRITRQRLGDPAGLGRRFYSVHGEGLAENVALVVQGHLDRVYLKHESTLVPLYIDDGVA